MAKPHTMVPLALALIVLLTCLSVTFYRYHLFCDDLSWVYPVTSETPTKVIFTVIAFIFGLFALGYLVGKKWGLGATHLTVAMLIASMPFGLESLKTRHVQKLVTLRGIENASRLESTINIVTDMVKWRETVSEYIKSKATLIQGEPVIAGRVVHGPLDDGSVVLAPRIPSLHPRMPHSSLRTWDEMEIMTSVNLWGSRNDDGSLRLIVPKVPGLSISYSPTHVKWTIKQDRDGSVSDWNLTLKSISPAGTRDCYYGLVLKERVSQYFWQQQPPEVVGSPGWAQWSTAKKACFPATNHKLSTDENPKGEYWSTLKPLPTVNALRYLVLFDEWQTTDENWPRYTNGVLAYDGNLWVGIFDLQSSRLICANVFSKSPPSHLLDAGPYNPESITGDPWEIASDWLDDQLR